MKKKLANTIEKVVKKMANMACGSASMWGIYQPKEPKIPKK